MTAPDTEVRMPNDVPPKWANSIMKWAITTKGIQAWVGTGVALLRFTGRRSGKHYEIPVSFQQDGDVVTVVTKRVRKWWHNFETPAEVGIRIAGKEYTGKAEVWADEAEVLGFMTGYLDKRPVDAKAYGLKRDEITAARIARIVPHIVVIRIETAPVEQPATAA